MNISKFDSIDTHFDSSTMTAFENIVGKGEIARNEQFLLFPQFSTQSDNCIPICPYFLHHNFICC